MTKLEKRYVLSDIDDFLICCREHDPEQLFSVHVSFSRS